jgi:hypothetical protein
MQRTRHLQRFMFLMYIPTAGLNVQTSVSANVTGNLFVVFIKLHQIDAREVPYRTYKDTTLEQNVS